MTSGATVASTGDGAPRFRLRLLASCVLLIGLAMTQSSGLLVADTKLDLAVAPVDFLQRAAHLWDAEGAFGQLQNQAYGYLWPMGPFFVLGWLLDLPGWIVQRLWLALVMCVALVGSARLARALGVRSDLACLVAGFAYALSPRMLTTLGPISIEAWPSALAPWVLLPLVVGSTRGSPRRAAALSAVAVAMVGGVNAAATFAVLPLGALWLLTRTAGPRRRSMMLWWPLFTALGTLWWLVPLFLMGAYSPPFLDYIESAANTTFPTTLFDSLRGTSNWVPYVDLSSRAGNDLLRDFYLPLNSGVVLVAGLVGLMLRRNPHRVFLVSGVVLGLLLVTLGHTGAVQGWFAPQLQLLLDGSLAPLRNVHKFDPVIRLPMVMGLAWALEELVRRAQEGRDPAGRTQARVLTAVVVFGVVAASLPAVAGRVTPARGFPEIPDYWAEAAAWLGEEQDEGVALLVPGSSFGQYAWGLPRDEPLQVLGDTPWAVRNAVPLTPPGNIRMLDAVEARLAEGRGSAGLTAYLRRAGVSHLVVRNDLERSSDIVDPVLVHQAIEGSPGLDRVATFGPPIGGEAHLEQDGRRVVINGGWQDTYPAIEVYEVVGAAFARSTDEPTVVVGGPEDLLDLADLFLLDSGPALLAGDADAETWGSAARVVLTDGMRAVERHFGRLHDNTSETLLPQQEPRLLASTRDYLIDDTDRWSTHAAYEGFDGVTASSSGSDPSASGGSRAGAMPFSALDGHEDTWWESGSGAGPHWWQVDLGRALVPGEVEVTAGPGADQEVVLRTDDWVSAPVEIAAGRTVAVPVEGPTSRLRIEDASRRTGTPMALAEVSLPAVDPVRLLVLPRLPDGAPAPDAVVLRAVDPHRTGCATVDGAVRCVPGRSVAAEEPLGLRRELSLPEAVDYPASLTVRPLPGAALEALLLEELLVGVRASSVASPDTRAGALAAVDGDPGTTWTAEGEDLRPTLELNWLGRRTIDEIEVAVSDDTAARSPVSLLLRWPRGRRTVELGADGTARFPPIRTSQLSVSVLDAERVTSIDFEGSGFEVPVGIGELRVGGLPFLPLRLVGASTVRFPCGSGPDVTVNGSSVQTSVVGATADLLAGRPVSAELCGGDDVSLRGGVNRLDVIASAAFTPQSLVLGEQPGWSGVGTVDGTVDGAVERSLEVGDDTLVGTRENANPGWVGRYDGAAATSVVVDGWRQGWRLDADASSAHPLVVRFAPDGPYRVGLALGLLALLLLLGSVLLVRSWGRSDQPAVTGVEGGLPVQVLAVVAGGLLAGWPGAAVGLGVLAGVRVLRRRAGQRGVVVVAGMLLPAVAAYVITPWGDSSGWAGDMAWPHYFVVAGVCGAVAWVGEDRPLRRGSRMRMAGISTRRYRHSAAARVRAVVTSQTRTP